MVPANERPTIRGINPQGVRQADQHLPLAVILSNFSFQFGFLIFDSMSWQRGILLMQAAVASADKRPVKWHLVHVTQIQTGSPSGSSLNEPQTETKVHEKMEAGT